MNKRPDLEGCGPLAYAAALHPRRFPGNCREFSLLKLARPHSCAGRSLVRSFQFDFEPTTELAELLELLLHFA
jgi:hypothetical protein